MKRSAMIILMLFFAGITAGCEKVKEDKSDMREKGGLTSSKKTALQSYTPPAIPNETTLPQPVAKSE